MKFSHRMFIDAEKTDAGYLLTAPDGTTGLIDAPVFEAMFNPVADEDAAYFLARLSSPAGEAA